MILDRSVSVALASSGMWLFNVNTQVEEDTVVDLSVDAVNLLGISENGHDVLQWKEGSNNELSNLQKLILLGHLREVGWIIPGDLLE